MRRQGTQVPQLLLGSAENCKMVKKGGTIPTKLWALQHIFCVQDTKYQQSKVQDTFTPICYILTPLFGHQEKILCCLQAFWSHNNKQGTVAFSVARSEPVQF